MSWQFLLIGLSIVVDNWGSEEIIKYMKKTHLMLQQVLYVKILEVVLPVFKI